MRDWIMSEGPTLIDPRHQRWNDLVTWLESSS